MKKYTVAEILSNREISDEIYEMIVHVPEVVELAKPGQFVNVFIDDKQYILPRPISISEINKEEGTLTFVYQMVGKGTQWLTQSVYGQEIKVLGPLGNGFDISQAEGNHVLVGGGIGVPPLYELAKNLKGNVTIFIGARTKPILIEKFKSLGVTVHVATDDGSVGFKGNVVQLMDSLQPQIDDIYSCGPKVMLKFLSKWALEKGINPQVSMEERMACGIGACVGCVVKIQKANEKDWQNLKVCKDGPVFLGSEVVWDD